MFGRIVPPQPPGGYGKTVWPTSVLNACHAVEDEHMVESSALLDGPSARRPPALLARRLPAAFHVAADHVPICPGSTPASADSLHRDEQAETCTRRMTEEHVLATDDCKSVPVHARAAHGHGTCLRTLQSKLGPLTQNSYMSCPHLRPAPPGGDSKRHFLAYNLVGCVTCRQDEGCQVVEVLFHDQRGRQRVPHLSDYFGFTMAALGSKARPRLLTRHATKVVIVCNDGSKTSPSEPGALPRLMPRVCEHILPALP